MKLTIAFLGLMCLLPAQGMEFSKKIVDKIHLYNLLANCWGNEAIDNYAYDTEKAMEKCGVHGSTTKHTKPAPAPLARVVQPMQSNVVYRTMPQYFNTHSAFYNPYVALGRRKRQAAHEALEPHSDADLANFGSLMNNQVEALTCVLREVGMLDANNNIQADQFSLEKLQVYSNTPAGKDPAFLVKYSQELTDCYNVAMTWPQSALNKNEFMAKHGRKMIYFRCLKQTEMDMCMKFQMNQYLEFTSGKELDPAKYGAKDKYDAAATVARVMEGTSTKAAAHIDAFFWGTPETMFDM